MRISKILLNCLLALTFGSFFTVGTDAQQLKISAKFDSTSVLIGDQVKLHLELDHPENVKVILPTFKDTLSKSIEIIKVFPVESSKKDGKIHLKQDLLVTSFDSGYHQVAPILFPYQSGNRKDTLRTASLFLKVSTLPADTTKSIRDIKPPLSVPFSLLDYWMYIAISLGLIVLGFIIWLLIKLRKKEPLFGPVKLAEPPHIIALRQLDTLRAEKLWQSDKSKLYYTRLTEIIRAYLEKRFEINALEMTSDEIIDSLKKLMIEDLNSIDLLHILFVTADLVKFAKGQPLPNENEINLLNAYQFVNNTKINVPAPSLLETAINEDDSTILPKDAKIGGFPVTNKQNDVSKASGIVRFLIWFKRIKLLHRLALVLIAVAVLVFEGIPDTIFNLREQNAPSFSIAELKSMSDSQIPRYLTIKESTIPGDSYVSVMRVKRGDSTLSHIYYPVYPMNKSADEKAYIIVKDSRVKKNEVDNYFKSILQTKVDGKYDNQRIDSKERNLFENKGIQIDPNAIIIERGQKPWPLMISTLVSFICIFFILILTFSLLPKKIVSKIFGGKN